MLDHFLVRIRGSELRIRFHYGTTSGFDPRAISQNRQNRKFSACRGLEKSGGEPVLPRKCPGQNRKRKFSWQSFSRMASVTEGPGRPTQKSLASACITAMINGFLGQG